MISQREKNIYFSFCVTQIFLITLLFAVFYYINDSLRASWISAPHNYFQLLLVMIITLIGESSLRPISQRISAGRTPPRIARVLARRQTLWLAAGFGVTLALTRDTTISRSFLVAFTALSYPFFLFTNKRGRRFLNTLSKRNLVRLKFRTLVIGPESWGIPIRNLLASQNDYYEVEPLFTVDQDIQLSTIFDKIDRTAPDLIVIPSHDFSYDTISRLLSHSDRKGIRCWIPLEISRHQTRSFDIQNVGGISFLSPPALPLAHSRNRLLKRLFDIAVSLFIIPFILFPLVVIVAIIQRLSSPGPIFYKQERVGQDGRVFEIVKFRSMHIDNENEAKQAARHDSRIYKGGQWLRKLSVDEFPQFLNVLRGEMSIVGPRPHMIEHEREFEQFYELYGARRYVKPGVTGLAQVEGFRGEITSSTDVRGRARYDLFYVRHWSFGLDLRIILQTLGVVIFPPKQAY